MKAIVLCGGLPQTDLIQNLKKRGIYSILADMNPNVPARQYADEFYPVSALDCEGIKKLALEKKADFIISVCADQVLQAAAEVSESLGLPCYIDRKTAVNVSNKIYMKDIFHSYGIPTSKYLISENIDEDMLKGFSFPIIVKPVDTYSSRGVKKASNIEEVLQAFENAKKISRTGSAIVEEFVSGTELSVDVYVEEGKAKVLCVTELDKVREKNKFVIYRALYPARISEKIYHEIEEVSQKICSSFKIENAPMLIQLISDGKKISVLEFCARTGGGIKYLTIRQATGFDVIDAVIELTLGRKPHYEHGKDCVRYIATEHIYCKPGTFDHIEGFSELKNNKAIYEFYQYRQKGHCITGVNSSGDRVAGYTVHAGSYEELKEKLDLIHANIKIIDINGEDIARHDLLEPLNA